MHRVVLVLCLWTQVIGIRIQTHRYSHHARHSGSNIPPSLSERNYNNFDEIVYPYNKGMEHKSFEGKPIDHQIIENMMDTVYPSNGMPDIVTKRIPYHFTAIPKHNPDYDSVANYLRSNIESDIMIEKLQSMMHYVPSNHELDEGFAGYDTSSDFQNDDDDVRSSSGTMYGSYWPYLYHNSLEYEISKAVSDGERAKDKRYISDASQRVIPIHEHIDEDTPTQRHVKSNIYVHTPISKHKMIHNDHVITTENPFLSFEINDYFDKNKDDTLTFNSLSSDWGKDFDHESYRPLLDQDISRKIRRLDDFSGFDTLTTVKPSWTRGYVYPVTEGSILKESETGDSHKRRHEFDKHGKGENKKASEQSAYNNGENKFEAFKKFADSFTNKFGSEDHKKNAKFSHKMNKDNGGNKKGFRRVYHKDEFQEDNEYYDNFNNSMKGEDKGSLNAHIGGSEGLLGSLAIADLKDTANAVGASGNTENKIYTNSNSGHTVDNRNNFNKYIDVAKEAVKSNYDDYLDLTKYDQYRP